MADKKINIKDILLDILICSAGSFIYAVGVNCFVSPNELSSGGATGLAILANYLWGFPSGTAMFAINIPLFNKKKNLWPSSFNLTSLLFSSL